jgi:hypothetical protein
MMVGTLKMVILLRQAQSLKDKRRVVKSLKDHVRNKFSVAVAEVDALDRVQQAVIGVAVVGNERRFVESVLTNVANFTGFFRDCELIDAKHEIFSQD